MCICLEPAKLTDTVIVAHQATHEGRPVNVIGYMNTADSVSREPNAMILPIPSAAPMSSDNCIDMTGTREAFGKYARMFEPRARGKSVTRGIAAAAGPAGSIQVFSSGSYTVALTKQASLPDLRRALNEFPEGKRIALNRQRAEVFRSFRTLYPDWYLAVCVWEGFIEADPILWWYEPMDEYVDNHFVPGLDAHDGNPPDPSLMSVPIDHTVVVGDVRTQKGDNAMDVVALTPERVWKWLPTHVYGAHLRNRQARNGDWVLPKKGWDNVNMFNRITDPRVPPPGYSA
jgi:hypothetical protein